MVLLSTAFLIIVIMVFGAIVLMARSTPEQKAVERRLTSVLSGPTELYLPGHHTGSMLTILETVEQDWISKLIGSSNFAKKIRLLILQSQKRTSVQAIVIYMASVAVLLFLVVYLSTTMIIAALFAMIVGAYVPLGFLQWTSQRRLAAFNTVLPDSIETCSRSLRAGHSLIAAIGIVAEQAVEPAKTEFNEVFKKQNYGLPLRDALLQMLQRVPSSDLQVLVTGILVQKDTGGNLAEILDRISAVIRDRVRIKGEIKIHTAQGRLTGWILFLLPIVMMVLINVINPGYSSILFNDPLGQKILYAGIGMLIVGGFIIRKIINGIEV
jgi:tight adherence protein B